MDKEKIISLKNKLIEEKKDIEKTLDAIKDNGNLDKASEGGELSLIDNHPADNATETFDKERNYALMGNEKKRLFLIDDALKKIENGKYGKCEICGKDIPYERLEFLPFVKTCIDCENEYNKKIQHKKRPVEEEAMTNPFAASREFNDNEYDGDDTLDQLEYNNKKRTMNTEDGYVEDTDRISNGFYKRQLPR